MEPPASPATPRPPAKWPQPPRASPCLSCAPCVPGHPLPSPGCAPTAQQRPSLLPSPVPPPGAASRLCLLPAQCLQGGKPTARRKRRMRESNTPPLALAMGTTVDPMPQGLFLARVTSRTQRTHPRAVFWGAEHPQQCQGHPVRVSCPGLGPAEMPFPKAGWACLWGSFYLHKQPLGGQRGCGFVRACPYRQPRSEGNVNTDGWAGNAAAPGHPHRDGVRHHPVLRGPALGSPGLRGGVGCREGWG